MTIFLHTILIALVTLSLLAQSPPKRKKVKNFGSSLKRLKWNAQKNAAETRQDKKNAIAEEEDVIRIDTTLVSSDVLVLDRKGKTISGLTADDFMIAEDGVSQTVGHFFNGDNVDVPRTIVLIIDYSGSQLPYLDNSVKAAKLLVDKLGPKDTMAIVTDDVEMIQDFTADKKRLKEKLDKLVELVLGKNRSFDSDGLPRGDGFPRFGRSRQYSALMATLNEVFQEDDVRRIVIFQTDGDEAYYLRNPRVDLAVPPGLKGKSLKAAQDSLRFFQQFLLERGTEFALEDLYRAVEREHVTLYTVIPGVRLWGLPPEEQLRKWQPYLTAQTPGWMGHLPSDRKADMKERLQKDPMNSEDILLKTQIERVAKMQAMLASVATVSGGWADFLEAPEQADAIYSRIFSDINRRYIVGYYPTNKERDGKRRKIEFKVKGHPEYQVYGRLWYFAPEP